MRVVLHYLRPALARVEAAIIKWAGRLRAAMARSLRRKPQVERLQAAYAMEVKRGQHLGEVLKAKKQLADQRKANARVQQDIRRIGGR